MRKITIFTILAVTALLFSCKDNSLSDNELIQKGRTLCLSASMPVEEGLQTRIALVKDNKNILLTWEDGDQIQLCFVQGATKVKQTVTVKNISTDRKRAEFDITIPAEITSGYFDLYGLYGGGGLKAEDPTLALLPASAENAVSLNGVMTRKDLMLKFGQTNIDVNNPTLSVNFQNIGSLFCISVKNTSASSVENIGQIRIKAASNGWAYNTGSGGAQYDLVNNVFTNGPISDNYLSFNVASSTVAASETIELWAWYAPVPSAVWPELKLEILDTDDVSLVTSTNSKSARTQATAAGKSYYFFAVWDGTELLFTDETFTPPPSIDDLTIPGDLLHAENGSDFIGVVYSKSGTLYYNEAQSDGSWSGEVTLGTGTEARIAIDGADHPHIVYTTADNKIAYLNHNGTDWSSVSYIESNNAAACYNPDIAVRANGIAHITYTDNNGNGDGYRDIMYADNSTGSFVKTLIYNGYYDYYGGGSSHAEYYDGGSRIAIDGTGNYYILVHAHIIDRAAGWTDHSYGLRMTSNTASGEVIAYATNGSNTYDLEYNGTEVKALYAYTGTNSTSTMTTAGSALSFTGTQNVTTAISPNTISANASATVIGGNSSSVLFTKYNSFEKVYTGVIVKSATSVAVVNVGGVFYAVYTDNSDGKIKIQKVPNS